MSKKLKLQKLSCISTLYACNCISAEEKNSMVSNLDDREKLFGLASSVYNRTNHDAARELIDLII